MKHLIILTLSLIFVSCSNERKPNNEKKPESDKLQIELPDSVKSVIEDRKQNHFGYVKIDSIILPELAYDKNCFLRSELVYPKINLNTKWNKTNKIIEDSVLNFVTKSLAETTCSEEEDVTGPMGWATADYDILNNDSSILSIALNLTCGFGGGNMWIPKTNVFNINSTTGELMDISKYLIDVNINNLNKIIYLYFNQCFPNQVEETIGKHFISNEIDLNELNFGFKNDSMFLFIPAYPAGHSSYYVYSIPVKKI